MNTRPDDDVKDPGTASLEADLARLRDMPVPDGLEARLVEAIPWRKPRTAALGWLCWVAAAAAACVVVGVLAWQAGYDQGRVDQVSVASVPPEQPGNHDGRWTGSAGTLPGGVKPGGAGAAKRANGLRFDGGGPRPQPSEAGGGARARNGVDVVAGVIKQISGGGDGTRLIGSKRVGGAEPGHQPADDPDEPIGLRQSAPPEAEQQEEFHTYNVNPVINGPKNPTKWTTREPAVITYINTYHWNNGRGAAPGKISLKHEDGTVYGPWQAMGSDGAGNVKNAIWFVEPRAIVKPGTYTVVDSDPETWSHNAASKQCGFAHVRFKRLAGRFGAANRFANGLVALWPGDGDARDRAGGNHGQIKGGVTFAEGRFGKAFKLDGKDGYIDFGNPKALQITGSQTIAMWIRPDDLAAPRNVLHKAFGGEGDITLDADGQLAYHYGQAGQDGVPYAVLFTGGRTGIIAGRAHAASAHADPPVKRALMKPNEWAHIVIVREMKTEATELTWYVNGELVVRGKVRQMGITASNLPLMIGKGHAANFAGLIDDVAMWNRSLNASEVRAVFDGGLRAGNPLANGMAALWAGDGDARDSAGGSHGKIKGGVTFAEGKFGKAFKLDGKDGHIDFGSPRALQITGSQTIAMWIRPDRLGLRQNPIAKACGGEGTITIEPDGAVSYDYGTSGDAQHSPHCYIGTYGRAHVKHAENQPTLNLKSTGGKAVVKAGQWSHIAVVRDLESRKLRLYINGKEIIEGEAAFPAAIATDLPLMIGKGYVSNFAGLIDDVGIWNRPLSAEEVRLLHQTPGLRNVATASGTMVVAPTVKRTAGADRVLVTDSTVLLGTLENPSFAVTTFFGRIEIPARDLAGIVPVEDAPGQAWLLLADGQAIRGELGQAVLRLRLAGGSILKVPLKEVRECGIRMTEHGPAGRTETTTAPASPMMVILRSGERLACTDLTEDLSLETPYGRVALPAQALLRIEPSYDRLVGHRVMLRSGSQLSGTLTREKVAVKLQLGPEATIHRQQLVSLSGSGEAAAPGDRATVLMLNGDTLIGEITDKALIVRTRFGDAEFAPASALTVRFDPAGGVRAAVRLWDGSGLSGELVEPAVTFTAGADGPTLKLPLAQASSIIRSSALPPPKIIEEVKKLISQLGAESHKDRQAATESLVKMGAAIIPLLEKYLDAPDPEVRNRLEAILERLRPEAKGAPPPHNPQQPGRGGGIILPGLLDR